MAPASVRLSVARTRKGAKRFKKASYFTPRSVRPATGLFTKSKIVTMRYVSTWSLSSSGATGAVSTVIYSMNGLYDPYYAAGGHQPLGFDQYMNFYNHYTVLSAKAVVTAINTTGTPSGMLYLSRNAGAALISNRETLSEQPETKTKGIYRNNAMPHSVITDTVSLSAQLGQNVKEEDNNAGTDSLNPAEQYYWHIGCASFDGTDGTTVGTIAIDYRVLLHEPKPLAGS
jgi:hypothetical protein